MFKFIKTSEIQAFFCTEYGYNTIADSSGVYIFPLEKKGFQFIYLRPRVIYWKPSLRFWIWLDRKMLSEPFNLVWAKFCLHTEINRTIRKQSKNK